MSTILTSNPRLAAFVLAEASGQRSRENIVVTQSGAEIKSGTLLSKTTTGAATFAMDVDAAGNPTVGAIGVASPAVEGVYTIEFTSATAFTVKNPSGGTVATGSLGTAFNNGGLTFTLTAGTDAAEAGDTATLDVELGTQKYVPYTNGTADAILYNYLPAKTGDTPAVAFVRDCEVNRKALTGLDDAAVTDLAGNGVIVRGRTDVLSSTDVVDGE